MEGLRNLNALPDNVKNDLILEYGSLEHLYLRLLWLSWQQFLATKNPEREQRIRSVIMDIEDRIEEVSDIEELNIDGRDVSTWVGDDVSEVLVSEKIHAMDEYLQQFGTTFEEAQKELHRLLGD